MSLFSWIKAVFSKEFSVGDIVSCIHRNKRCVGTVEKYIYDEKEKCVYYKIITHDRMTCFWKKGEELQVESGD